MKTKFALVVILFCGTMALSAPGFALSTSSSSSLCREGDKAMVLWKNQWWPAVVVDVSSSGSECKVHYQGYGAKYDEWVGKDRIKVFGREAQQDRTYRNGERVQVYWGDRWWNAKIVKKRGDMYYVNYEGYGRNWNEWVGMDRVRPISSTGGYYK